jgi:hypothetical protein
LLGGAALLVVGFGAWTLLQPDDAPVEEPVVEQPETTAIEEPVVEEPVVEEPVVEEPVVEEPAAPVDGVVSVEGDALKVLFEGSDGKRRGPGPLAPGDYVIVAAFSDGVPHTAGKVTVSEGKTVTVVCNQAFAVCKPR